jgi:hypothetical protein
MPSTGTARAREKSNPAAPPTKIAITNGVPDKKIAYVNVEGTVTFENNDSTGYRIRLWAKGRRRHPLIDVLLAQVQSVTLMADPRARKKDACEYDVLSVDLKHPDGSSKVASGGGGKIIIGPTPGPKKPTR